MENIAKTAKELGLDIQFVRTYINTADVGNDRVDLDRASAKDLDTYMAYWSSKYNLSSGDQKRNQRNVREMYDEDFKGWTESHFSRTHRMLRRQTLYYLARQGIYPSVTSTRTKDLVQILNGKIQYGPPCALRPVVRPTPPATSIAVVPLPAPAAPLPSAAFVAPAPPAAPAPLLLSLSPLMVIRIDPIPQTEV
ncbi:hypothetical protein EKO27_g3422 [Xylaria grammica]|uniref:Uncharacterized protein n=1 Tax=Xylaria grammica TaxID=363999 RepID=A0A439DBA3_9PEZI|nr:hypothetical protein EKO27_g3422 [Xylaria grammica]